MVPLSEVNLCCLCYLVFGFCFLFFVLACNPLSNHDSNHSPTTIKLRHHGDRTYGRCRLCSHPGDGSIIDDKWKLGKTDYRRVCWFGFGNTHILCRSQSSADTCYRERRKSAQHTSHSSCTLIKTKQIPMRHRRIDWSRRVRLQLG